MTCGATGAPERPEGTDVDDRALPGVPPTRRGARPVRAGEHRWADRAPAGVLRGAAPLPAADRGAGPVFWQRPARGLTNDPHEHPGGELRTLPPWRRGRARRATGPASAAPTRVGRARHC